MRDSGVKKNPGYGIIEMDEKFHAFFAADVSHVHSEDIYSALKNIYFHLKWEGYVLLTWLGVWQCFVPCSCTS